MRCKAIFLSGIVLLFARESVSKVLFLVPDTAFDQPPRSVSLVGNFNSWNSESNKLQHVLDSWTTELDLNDGRYYYKFYLVSADGSTHWMLDPTHPYLADNGQGGANNVVDVQNGEFVAPRQGMEHFIFFRPEVKGVDLAGDFNDWRLGQFPLYDDPSGGSGQWHCWVELRRPLTYKFVADGIWHPDYGQRGPGTSVPDGFGEINSYRAAADPDPPESAAISDIVMAGNAALLDRIKAYEQEGDYSRAITLARQVAAENERLRGAADPIRQAALSEEARIHKRWAKFDRAAAALRTLAALDDDTSATRTAVWELSAYYTFIAGAPAETRRITEQALARMPHGTEYVKLAARHLEAAYTERDFEQVTIEADHWLELLPPPEGREPAYACQITEILLFKANAQRRLGQLPEARATSEDLIAMHPYPNSQNVAKAREIIEAIADVVK